MGAWGKENFFAKSFPSPETYLQAVPFICIVDHESTCSKPILYEDVAVTLIP